MQQYVQLLHMSFYFRWQGEREWTLIISSFFPPGDTAIGLGTDIHSLSQSRVAGHRSSQSSPAGAAQKPTLAQVCGQGVHVEGRSVQYFHRQNSLLS